jgi:type I restriction enzyme, S subunit
VSDQMVLLKDLLVTTKDGDWGKSEPTDGYLPYRVIRGTDFARARFGNVTTVPLRYLPERTVARRTLEPNDILIETAGGTSDRPTGRSMLVTARLLEQLGGPATCASFARFLRVNTDLAHPAYVYWYLQELYRHGAMRQHEVRHTGVARFQYTRFAETEAVPLPPMPDQLWIAASLRALDDKIESNHRSINLAEALATALFAHEASERRTLTAVATLVMGSSPPGSSYNENGVGTPFYQGVRDFGSRYPEYRIWTTEPVRLAEDNDTLLSVRAPVGELNRAREHCCIGRGVAAVRSEATPSLVFYALRAADQLWAPFQSEGTVFGAINRTDLSNAEITWPPNHLVGALEDQLSSIDRKIRSLCAEIERLGELRDVLLPALLSGGVRVPRAAVTLESTA